LAQAVGNFVFQNGKQPTAHLCITFETFGSAVGGKHGFLHKVFRQIGAVGQLDAGETQEQLAGFGKLGVSQCGEGHNVLLSNEWVRILRRYGKGV
jgi:hypothetical protein